MIKIYRLTPEPEERGSFEHGILKMDGKEFNMTEKEVWDRFNRGYWRIGIT